MTLRNKCLGKPSNKFRFWNYAGVSHDKCGKGKGNASTSWSLFACQACVVLKSSHLLLTVEEAQLQKWCQSCEYHEEQESSSPPQKPDHRAHGQAGCQGNPSHGVVVRIEIVGNRHLRFVPHHTFCKTVVYAITSQPEGNRRGKQRPLLKGKTLQCDSVWGGINVGIKQVKKLISSCYFENKHW